VQEVPEAIVFRGDGPYYGMQIYSIDPEGLNEAEQWTFFDGAAFQECPKLSPDGRYIMYTFCDLAVGQIRLIDVLTGIDTDITPDGYQGIYSDFSHDGTKIVAAMASQWYGPHDLYTFDYDGSNVEQLTSGADVWAPEYNFDDSKIYYMEFQPSELRIYDVATGDITHYTDNGSWNDDPTGSPDGTQIAWATSYPLSGGRVIWVSPVDSWDPPDLIIDFEAYIRAPCFSPDGSKLVFDHGGFDASEIGIWDFDSGTWMDITDNEWGEYQCDWGIMLPH
jgi:Tol biopolymer transport system component